MSGAEKEKFNAERIAHLVAELKAVIQPDVAKQDDRLESTRYADSMIALNHVLLWLIQSNLKLEFLRHKNALRFMERLFEKLEIKIIIEEGVPSTEH